MTSLAPPISIHLSRHQLLWLDGRRRCGRLTRSAALRAALDALIQQEQEQGSGSPAERAAASRQLEFSAATSRQLEFSAAASTSGEG